jgi:hypothetical protein
LFLPLCFLVLSFLGAIGFRSQPPMDHVWSPNLSPSGPQKE